MVINQLNYVHCIFILFVKMIWNNSIELSVSDISSIYENNQLDTNTWTIIYTMRHVQHDILFTLNNLEPLDNEKPFRGNKTWINHWNELHISHESKFSWLIEEQNNWIGWYWIPLIWNAWIFRLNSIVF